MLAWLLSQLRVREHCSKGQYRRTILRLEPLEDRIALVADINNGLVRLGVNNSGALIINPQSAPMTSAGGTARLGLRYMPTNYEAVAPFLEVDGWGVANATTSAFGTDRAGVTTNLSAITLTSTPNSAVSTVTAAATFRVIHDYRPSSHPNVYLLVVTIENISAAPAAVRYRRTIDWDIEPTATSEYVTIQGSTVTGVLSFTNSGFGSQNPLVAPSGTSGDVLNSFGDLGCSVTFDLGTLAPGESTIFNTYYGATGDRATAEAALASLAIPIYTLATPSGVGNPAAGTPSTFFYGFNLNPITPSIRAFRPLRYSYNRALDTYDGNLTITTLTKDKANGPLYAIIRNLPAGVTAYQPDNYTPKGAPYYRLPGDGGLAGNSSIRLPIKLVNSTNVHMSTYFLGYTVEITGAPDDSSVVDPSGYVYIDANKNGVRDDGEQGIANVLVELNGVTDNGQTVYESMRTDANGYYNFFVLPGVYSLTQHQPEGYRDAAESLGSLGGNIENDRFTNIVVREGDNGTDYNFGEWINHAPVLLVENRSSHANVPVTFTLGAFDEDAYDDLEYTVHLADRSDLAYQLKQDLGLRPARKYAFDKLNMNEKWLTGSGKRSYLLLPEGDLYRYNGKKLEPTWVAKLTSDFYATPDLLTAAAEPVARFTVVGSQVTMTPQARYTGTLAVDAFVSDGLATDAKSFTLAVTNTAPTLAELTNRTMAPDSSISVDLASADLDSDVLSYAAFLANGYGLAFELRQRLGLRSTSKSFDNLGLQEKWFTGSNKQRFFLLPSGELYRYSGRRGTLAEYTLEGSLGADIYSDPKLLAGLTGPTVALTISGNQLQIKPRAGYRGSFTVSVSVDDGVVSTVRSFTVTVE